MVSFERIIGFNEDKKTAYVYEYACGL